MPMRLSALASHLSSGHARHIRLDKGPYPPPLKAAIAALEQNPLGPHTTYTPTRDVWMQHFFPMAPQSGLLGTHVIPVLLLSQNILSGQPAGAARAGLYKMPRS